MVAAAIIRIRKLAWVTYLGTLSCINAIPIPQISAHPPILAHCKVHRPWALFREGTVLIKITVNYKTRMYCADSQLVTVISSFSVLGF